LNNDNKINFLISLPASNNIFKSLIYDNLDIEVKQDINLSVISGSDLLLYRTKQISWSGDHKLFAHIYLNIKHKAEYNYDKIVEIKEMFDLATENPIKYKTDKLYNKYFVFRKSFKSSTGYKVSMKEEKNVDKYYKGWMILLSDEISDPKSAIRIYRNKNIVEEAFNTLKNTIKSKRLRVHGSLKIESKLFIDFISLIMVANIHNKMEKLNLYKKYTTTELLYEVNSIKEIIINGKKLFTLLQANN
jgi:hypothetical protein